MSMPSEDAKTTVYNVPETLNYLNKKKFSFKGVKFGPKFNEEEFNSKY